MSKHKGGKSFFGQLTTATTATTTMATTTKDTTRKSALFAFPCKVTPNKRTNRETNKLKLICNFEPWGVFGIKETSTETHSLTKK